MNRQRSILVAIAFELAASLIIVSPSHSLQSERRSSQEQMVSMRAPAAEVSVTTTAKLDGFRGLQLFPSQDDKWMPQKEFNDLIPRAGILQLPLGLITVTNAFSEPNSQLGAGLKFSFERVMVKRRDGTFLLLDEVGNPEALFDPTQGGRQTFPRVTRLFVTQTLTRGQTLTGFIELSDPASKAVLQFNALPFLNYRGEELYLLSRIVTPAGKPFVVSYTIDQTTKTPHYTRHGLFEITGDIKSGKISFRRSDLPGMAFSLTYADGLLTGLLGPAGEKHFDITTDSTGLITSFTDRYGYRTSFSYSQALWTGSCSHSGACSSLAFGSATFTSKSNISNYEVVTRFDPKTGLETETTSTVPSDPTYQGGRTTYNYEKAQSRQAIPFRLASTEFTIGDRPKVVTTFRYDTNDRLVQWYDTLNRSATYGYISAHSPFHEPTSIIQSLAGKVVSSVSYDYDQSGLITRFQNHLVKGGAPESAVSYTYDALGRLTTTLYGDGTLHTKRYRDAAFPDRPTDFRTNRDVVSHTFDASGLIRSVTHLPTQSQISLTYNGAGKPTSVVTSFPTLGSKTEWRGSYKDKVYITSETVRETNQGVAATTYAARYTWDELYRNIVAKNTDKPDLNTGPSQGFDFPFVLGDTGDQSQKSDEVSKPAGVREDATGCSPCAAQAFYSAQDGSLVPEGLQCDSTVNLVRPPPDISDDPE